MANQFIDPETLEGLGQQGLLSPDTMALARLRAQDAQMRAKGAQASFAPMFEQQGAEGGPAKPQLGQPQPRPPKSSPALAKYPRRKFRRATKAEREKLKALVRNVRQKKTLRQQLADSLMQKYSPAGGLAVIPQGPTTETSGFGRHQLPEDLLDPSSMEFLDRVGGGGGWHPAVWEDLPKDQAALLLKMLEKKKEEAARRRAEELAARNRERGE